ncbi:MAG: helix-turn-helix domain-containing protein [Bacteroidota bacterium]
MIYLKENIRYLRKTRGLTQQALAGALEIKRSLLGSYEEGRGVPKLDIIRRTALFFGISIDDLLTRNLSMQGLYSADKTTEVRILSIVVTPENEERISIVPVRAAAGYLQGRNDPDYLEELPSFSLPVAELSQKRSYRVFQIRGDSMLPIPSGSYLIGEYITDPQEIREGEAYVLITADEGIVYKRIYPYNEEDLLLKSDNPEYEPYTLHKSTILEIWQIRGFLSFEMPDPGAIQVNTLKTLIRKLEAEADSIREQIRR